MQAAELRSKLATIKAGAVGPSALTAAELRHARMAAGNSREARRALAPVLAIEIQAPERVRLQAWLIDARLSYSSGDRGRGHRSLASALRLAQREQLRLPFAIERGWIEPVLRRDPVLADAHQRLFSPAPLPPSSRPRRPSRIRLRR